jgi:hypothetical protein
VVLGEAGEEEGTEGVKEGEVEEKQAEKCLMAAERAKKGRQQ